MKIFITGIAGFIGMHLALALKKRGDHVIGCDNFNAYYSVGLKRNRAKLLKKQGIEVLNCDIREIDTLTSLFEKEKFERCINLAAQAGVRYSLKNPQAYIQDNLVGFTEVLELCKRFPQMKLIYASSSSVYGRNKKIPFSESDPVEHPSSLYAATKRANELFAESYHHLYGLSVTGLRFFTVYGPWGRPDMAYYLFTKSILEDKPIEVFNNGKMKRDFTYIDDIVDGTIKAIDLGCEREIFNLGNHRSEKLTDLIAHIEANLGKKAIIHYKPKPPGDVLETCADISKSEKILGFKPKTSLEEGIRYFTNWYKIFEECSVS